MTHPVSDILPVPGHSPHHGEGERGNPLSVLCVSDDPLFRDRVCRNLERDGDIFVEICQSSEDALHLMHYLFFDAVVTDSLSLDGEQNGFLRAAREQGVGIPVICVMRKPEKRIRNEARRYGRNRYLVWNGQATSPVFARLVQVIREMTATLAGNDVRGAFGWPDLAGDQTV